ncbi:MAG: hypothetical protein K6C36_00040 [Clostridia bacterium]|nr:hypothetical protein [Clostridia bacterium]
MEKLLKEFTDPGADRRGKPFWAWNGELRQDELIRQARIMKEMGLGGFFMHSRSGLITDYLGDEWFDCVNAVADEAEKDGMEAWLYDEDRWPSGSAGGKATADPKYRMKSLYLYESDTADTEWSDGSFALYAARIDGIDLYGYKEIDCSGISCREDAVRAAEKAVCEAAASSEGRIETNSPDGNAGWKALRFAIVYDRPDSVYNGATYIDTMSREATERFIKLTHEEYARRCGDRLGRSIKGIFTDEPHRGHCFDNLSVGNNGSKSCAVAWTDDIFDEFEKRYGFSCRKILPELFYRKNGEKAAPVKLFYIDLANALFLERFAGPIRDWCLDHDMIFTGHVLHEDSLMNQTVPHGSLMRFYEYMGAPGVDVLTEHNRCYWIVKQLSSAARQLGKTQMLSELYGCTGWQFSFKGHKNVGDWQALFGINLRCQHLSWYTMEGEAKRDYPASILHQSPWYKDYKTVEDHFARMNVVLSGGLPDCDVLLLNPIESVWCQAYMGWANSLWNASEDVEPYENRYAELFGFLTKNQIDFDYGEEEMMSRLASTETADGGAVLRVGRAEYRVVIVSNMLTIRPSTLDLLREFAEKGGKVVFCGDVPEYVDAVLSDEPARLAEKTIRVPYDEQALVSAVRRHSKAFVSVCSGQAYGRPGQVNKEVFAQVRRGFGGDGFAAVVLNTDRDAPQKGLLLSIRAPGGYRVREWDFDSGVIYDHPEFSEEDGGLYTISFDLGPGETRCFVLSRGSDPALPRRPVYETVASSEVTGKFAYLTDEPDVCVLDRCSWVLSGHGTGQEEDVLRVDRRLRGLVGIEARGGGMLQPWYSKHLDKKDFGKLCLSYEFFIDDLPEGPVYLAGERPGLNRYAINGLRLESPGVNDFWCDESLKKMEIPAGALRRGRNEVTVETTFRRTTNIEAVYLLGSFGVRLDGTKRTLTTVPDKIGPGNYSAYDMPFYTGNMTYVIEPEAYAFLRDDTEFSAENCRIFAEAAFGGACVKISSAGGSNVRGWEPFEADVTEAVLNNEPIYVTVEGSRANVFGPLHERNRPAPACGPGSFLTEGDDWTDDYSLIPCGLQGLTLSIRRRVG